MPYTILVIFFFFLSLELCQNKKLETNKSTAMAGRLLVEVRAGRGARQTSNPYLPLLCCEALAKIPPQLSFCSSARFHWPQGLCTHRSPSSEGSAPTPHAL